MSNGEQFSNHDDASRFLLERRRAATKNGPLDHTSEEVTEDSRAESLYDELALYPEQESSVENGSRYRWSSPFKTLVAVLCLGCCVLLGLTFFTKKDSSETGSFTLNDVSATPMSSSSTQLSGTAEQVFEPDLGSAGKESVGSDAEKVQVHIAGAVQSPGLYSLDSSLRWGEAIDKAGGATAEAELNKINLAQSLVDGSQIYVPKQGETSLPPQESSAVKSNKDSEKTSPKSSSTLININTATASELEELPRVGPKLAEKIIEYRETQGSFKSLDDLDNVPGIGPTMLENISSLVTFS